MNILEKYMDLTNSHDFAQMSAFLHKDCIINFNGKAWQGESLERYYVDAWNWLKDEHYWATDVTWLVDNDSTKTCLYQYHYKGHTDEGQLVSGTGKATNIFVIVNGEWKLIHEHLSREG